MNATLVTPETMAALVAGQPAYVVIVDGTGLVFARLGVGQPQVIDTDGNWFPSADVWRSSLRDERRTAIVGTAAVVAIDVLEDGHTVAGHPEIVPGDVVLTLADYQALAEPVPRSGINHAPARYTLPLVLTIGVLTEVEQ